MLQIILIIVISYILGSIPTAIIAGKLLKNIDIPLRRIFRTVMSASLMLSLALVVQIVILSAIPGKDISYNILKTVPLSLTHIFDLYKYPESSIIVFNAINPFEFLWIIIIYRG